jgi:hypothetical protein
MRSRSPRVVRTYCSAVPSQETTRCGDNRPLREYSTISALEFQEPLAIGWKSDRGEEWNALRSRGRLQDSLVRMGGLVLLPEHAPASPPSDPAVHRRFYRRTMRLSCWTCSHSGWVAPSRTVAPRSQRRTRTEMKVQCKVSSPPMAPFRPLCPWSISPCSVLAPCVC